MKYCPHCKRPSAKESGPCPHCGKPLDKLPSELSSSVGEGAPYSSTNLASAVGGSSKIAEDNEILSIDKVDSLELALDIRELKREEKERIKESSPQLLQEINIKEEAWKLANYGVVESGFFKAIKYFFRVLLRKRELRRELLKYNQKRGEVEKGYFNTAKELGKQVYETGPKGLAFEELYNKIQQLKEELSKEEGVLKEEEEEFLKAKAEVENKIKGIMAKEKPLIEKKGEVKGKIVEKNKERKNYEMMIKRLEIEIRNFETMIKEEERKIDSPQFQNNRDEIVLKINELREKIAIKEGEKEKFKVQYEALEKPIIELERELAVVEGELAKLSGERDLLNMELNKLSKVYEGKLKSLSERAHKITSEIETIYFNIGERFIEHYPDFKGLTQLIEVVKTKKEELQKITKEIQIYETALVLYDKEEYKRGIINIGSIILGIVVLIVIILILV